MKISLKLLLFLIVICVTQLTEAQKLPKLVKDANSLYKDEKFEQAIKLCEVILLSDKKTPDDIGAKASASWISCWIYKQPDYPARDINKSYQFAQQTADYYDQLIAEHPELLKYLSNLISSLVREKQQMLTDYPGCDKGEYNTAEIKKDSKLPKSSHEEVETNVTSKTTNENVVNNQTTNSKTNDAKTVTLVVSGQGKSLDEARTNALRSAIEQSFGTFISSNTSILNDSLVKDEIVSVSTGNIENYDIISENILQNGTFVSFLKTTVSINKLTNFCITKGISIEFKGGLFAYNIAMRSLNKSNEEKAWTSLNKILHSQINICTDYEIRYKEPKLFQDGINWIIPIEIIIKTNKNFDNLVESIISFSTSVSLKASEISEYDNNEMPYFPIKINSSSYYFRNNLLFDILKFPYFVYKSAIDQLKISNGLRVYSIGDYSRSGLISDIKLTSDIVIANGYCWWGGNGELISYGILGSEWPEFRIPSTEYLIDSEHESFEIPELKKIIVGGGDYNCTPNSINFNETKQKYLKISYFDGPYSIDEIKKISEYKVLPLTN